MQVRWPQYSKFCAFEWQSWVGALFPSYECDPEAKSGPMHEPISGSESKLAAGWLAGLLARDVCEPSLIFIFRGGMLGTIGKWEETFN